MSTMTEEIMAPGSVRITRRPDKGDRIDVVQVWGPCTAYTLYAGWDLPSARDMAETAVMEARTDYPDVAASAQVYDWSEDDDEEGDR
jgi:hypothetical protein